MNKLNLQLLNKYLDTFENAVNTPNATALLKLAEYLRKINLR